MGMIFHTGDFKFDHTPVMGDAAGSHAHRGDSAARACCCSSRTPRTQTPPGYTPSEVMIQSTLDRIMAKAPGRVIVATFASLIARVQQIVDAAPRNATAVSS